MIRKNCWVTIFLASLYTVGVLAANEAQTSAQNESLSARILSVTDVVLQNHIDPPTRQQMILTGVKALYLADKRQVPKNLSENISQLATQAQLIEYLDEVGKEFKELKNVEAILTHGILRSVPGNPLIIAAKESRVNEQVINNRYVGTGIALATNRDENLAQITKVFYDGPAWKAGIKTLDLILEIDGETTNSRNLMQVVEALRGEDGSEVEVVVRQPKSDESRKITMTRGRVFIPSVEGIRELSDGQWQYTLKKPDDIALLHFRSIGPSTLHELRKISAKLRQQNVNGIVIDLREGGGILHDIVMVADSLIDSGAIGHVRSLEKTIKHEARPGDLFDGIPMVVLVGKRTSAGNVFLAAALQDNSRAVVVGEPTVGETYVNSHVAIPGRDDQLRLAIAVMHRGDGTLLLPPQFSNQAGVQLTEAHSAETQSEKSPGFIMPDHVVRVTPTRATPEQRQNSDPVVMKAIEVLKNDNSQASSAQTDIVPGE